MRHILRRLLSKQFTRLNQSGGNSANLSSDDQALLESYFAASKMARKQTISQTKLVAVDFETTGLESNDQIVSMGFCPINAFQIKLAECSHLVVNPEIQLNASSVTIHNITDDQASRGISKFDALRYFLLHTEGAVIVAHYHVIERSFIQRLAKQTLGHTLPLNILDTFQIEKNKWQRRNQSVTPNTLRLFNIRKRYGLPKYNAHNALEDAIATAELFLAQLYASSENIADIRLNEMGLIGYTD